MRRVYVSLAKVPADHGITVNGEFTKMEDFHCDLCDKKISHSIAVAVSVYHRDKPLGDWEHEYGTVLPPHAVNVHDTLEGTTT